MNNTEELRKKIIGTTFVSKKTGIEGEIVDINKNNLFLEIEYEGAIPISINKYEEILEIDDNTKKLIKEYVLLSKKKNKEEK